MLRKGRFAITSETEHPNHYIYTRQSRGINASYNKIQRSLHFTLNGTGTMVARNIPKHCPKLSTTTMGLERLQQRPAIPLSPHTWRTESGESVTNSCIDLIDEISECLGSSSSQKDEQGSNSHPSSTSSSFVENVSI